MLDRSRAHSAAPQIFEYDYYQHLYELEEHHWWSISMRAIAERLLNPQFRRCKNPQVLDVGCGTGGMLSWLERYGDPRGMVGIDISRYALDFCRKRQLKHLAQVSITQLPFSASHFDLVNCLDVLQHLRRDGSDRRALQECLRVLKPGGYLYLRTNVRWGDEGRTEEPPEQTPEPQDYHQYERRELVRLLVENGFVLERVTYANMVPGLIRTWLQRLNPRHSGSHAAGHNPGLAVRVPSRGLNAVLKRLAFWEARYLARPRSTLPYGHSLICLASKPSSG